MTDTDNGPRIKRRDLFNHVRKAAQAGRTNSGMPAEVRMPAPETPKLDPIDELFDLVGRITNAKFSRRRFLGSGLSAAFISTPGLACYIPTPKDAGNMLLQYEESMQALLDLRVTLDSGIFDDKIDGFIKKIQNLRLKFGFENWGSGLFTEGQGEGGNRLPSDWDDELSRRIDKQIKTFFKGLTDVEEQIKKKIKNFFKLPVIGTDIDYYQQLLSMISLAARSQLAALEGEVKAINAMIDRTSDSLGNAKNLRRLVHFYIDFHANRALRAFGSISKHAATINQYGVNGDVDLGWKGFIQDMNVGEGRTPQETINNTVRGILSLKQGCHESLDRHIIVKRKVVVEREKVAKEEALHQRAYAVFAKPETTVVSGYGFLGGAKPWQLGVTPAPVFMVEALEVYEAATALHDLDEESFYQGKEGRVTVFGPSHNINGRLRTRMNEQDATMNENDPSP